VAPDGASSLVRGAWGESGGTKEKDGPPRVEGGSVPAP
jgi:hypothetical protein